MLLAHRLTSEGLEIVDDPIALEGALWVDVVDPSAEERTMLESVLRFDELVDETGTSRETAFILSPGLRTGWNIGDQQVIVGAAVPITWVDGDTEPGLLLYLSYELPFKKVPSK